MQESEITAEEVKKRISDRSDLSKILALAYSYRGKANEELHDFEGAISDFGKLIELGQFQDMPTEKICEYMSQISALKASIKSGMQASNSKTNKRQSLDKTQAAFVRPLWSS